MRSTRDFVLFAIVFGYLLVGIMFTFLVKTKLIKDEIGYYSSKGLYNTLKFILLWVYYIRFYIYAYPDYAWILLPKKNIFGYNKVMKFDMRPLRELNRQLHELNNKCNEYNKTMKDGLEECKKLKEDK